MKKTKRGFLIYDEFTDRYNSNIHIQESSIAFERCVWIQNQVTHVNGVHLGNAHLTVEMAKRVITALQAFVDEKGRE